MLLLLIFTNECVFTDVGVDSRNNTILLQEQQQKLQKPQRCCALGLND